MHTIGYRLILFFCLCLSSNYAFAQEPKPLYVAKYDPSPHKKIINSTVAVNQVITSVLPPNISYQTPQVFLINAPITPLVPANSGGTIPATIYGEVSDYAPGFSTATGIAVNAAGGIYVADWGTNQIIKVSSPGAQSVFAGSGASGPDDGQGTAASFNTPDALATDAAGNVYVADQANNMIRKITPGGRVSTLAGSTTPGANDGTGATASFNNPRGLTIDINGDIYVADQANNLIRKITPAGVVTTYAGGGNLTNGPRLSVSFSTPTAVEIDAAGNLYVSDSSNGVIRKISAAGDVSTFATGFTFPRELRIDGTGNLYVADQNEGRIKRVSPAGVVTTITISGAANGQNFFGSPIGIMLDGKGNLFVASGDVAKKLIVSGYAIDKDLPPGLVFDVTTGTISGAPATLWPESIYNITAYNGGGSSTTTLSIQVLATAPLKQSVITLPIQDPHLDANNNYSPGGTSTNNETPITYTSSNPTIAVPTADGLIHLLAPGVTTITASQAGNANYYPANQVSQQLTVVEHLYVAMQPIQGKTICDPDFDTETAASNATIPLTFNSSNPAVATVSPKGTVHIISTGTTNITISQNGNPPLYVSAAPVSQTLTVVMPQLPSVDVSANYASPCAGGTITFTATAQNAGAHPNYQWKLNGAIAGTNRDNFISTTLKKGDVITCAVTNTDDNCVANYPALSNAVTVYLVTPQTPSVSIDASATSVLEETTITFTATVHDAIGDVTYEWYTNGAPSGSNSAFFVNNNFSNGDIVTCTVTPVAACSTAAQSQPVTLYVVQKVTAPNIFTPNNDGTNDLWTISGIASYPKCVVTVYNRYGMPVFQSRGYQTAWNGMRNGKLLPASTYYYVIDLGYKNQRLSGYVTILR